MDTNTRQLVQAVHDSNARIVLVAAGAGTQALSNLLNVAGASRTLLEALVPYSEASFDTFLGQTPMQYVAEETARLMAGRALSRAHWLDPSDSPLIGLSCTATIITDRPKQGQHRAYMAIWQPEKLICRSVFLQKGARDRTGEEAVVSNLMLNLLAEACGLDFKLDILLGNGDSLTETRDDFEEAVQALLAGKRPFFTVADNGRLSHTEPTAPLLLSGSFNPLHDGHLEMAQTANRLLGKPVTFELPASNADKPPLTTKTVLQRLAQFAGRYPVCVSMAPTFIEKSRIYPGTTFVVGYDTAQRILHPRFYQDSQAKLIGALSEIKAAGCSFLVAGRVDDNGRFHQATDLTIPTEFKELFQPIPFRNDISSTALRNAGEKGSR